MPQLGKKVIELIQHLGLSQAAFGRKVGITSQSMSNMKRGSYDPRASTIEDILREYEHIDANWFFREGFSIELGERDALIKSLSKEIAYCKAQNQTLQQLVENQAKTISLLEKSLQN